MEILKYIAIVIAIYFLYKIIRAIKVNKKENLLQYTMNNEVNIISLDNMYIIVAISLFVVLGLIITHLYDATYENFIKLLAPLGIILSASIASLSVLKSIENTNRIEEEKILREKKLFINKLSTYIQTITLVTQRFINYNTSKFIDKNKEPFNQKSYLATVNIFYEDFILIKNILLKDLSLISYTKNDNLNKLLHNILLMDNMFLLEKYKTNITFEEFSRNFDTKIIIMKNMINIIICLNEFYKLELGLEELKDSFKKMKKLHEENNKDIDV